MGPRPVDPGGPFSLCWASASPQTQPGQGHLRRLVLHSPTPAALTSLVWGVGVGREAEGLHARLRLGDGGIPAEPRKEEWEAAPREAQRRSVRLGIPKGVTGFEEGFAEKRALAQASHLGTTRGGSDPGGG